MFSKPTQRLPPAHFSLAALTFGKTGAPPSFPILLAESASPDRSACPYDSRKGLFREHSPEPEGGTPFVDTCFYPWINSHDTDADAGRMDSSCRTSKHEDRRNLLSSKLNFSKVCVRLTGSGHQQTHCWSEQACFKEEYVCLKICDPLNLLRISIVRSATCFALICPRETVRRIEQG
jgi:hypothetical protein